MSKSRRRATQDFVSEPELPLFYEGPKTKRVAPLAPKTENQDIYMRAIRTGKLTFGLGPAGTGKTFIAASMAADALKNRQIKKIILTRPAIEAGESLGFLPGLLEEKFDPFMRPFKDVLNERLGQGFLNYAIKDGRIEALPLAYMRGMTFKDCWVILDEAQNTTPTQMKMFLTRIGEGSKIIVNGDLSQKDIPGRSGLSDGVQRVAKLPDVRVVRFTRDDVVRDDLVQQIIDCYTDPARDETENENEGLLRALGV
jgi:phosphate starvation-inducible PhoH-like protein